MPEPDVDALENELAEVARQIGGLLLNPEHDEADLRALDKRAAGLRRRLAAGRPKPVERDSLDVCHGISRRGGPPLVSGG